ncbi:MAG: HupE/UreJ family protein [Rhodoferax sp.]
MNRRAGARRTGVRVWPGALLLGLAAWAQAHQSLPASLLLQEQQAQVFALRWRVPDMPGQASALWPRLPPDCSALSQPTPLASPGAHLWQWQVQCQQGLRGGAQIGFDGLPLTSLDVLVRVAYRDGSTESQVARARQPSVNLGKAAAAAPQANGYLALGVAHILGGLDHLLFVLCLILLVPQWLNLLKTITAFTLAHSLTLALAALGLVHLPQPPVEALIALSILFLARELVHSAGTGKQRLRRPWAMAFAFGLLHGFGFASALAEVGLPSDAVALALLLFNLGVEAGQLLFVGAVWILLRVLSRVAARTQRQPRWLPLAPAFSVGALAAFWWLQRMLPVLGVAP